MKNSRNFILILFFLSSCADYNTKKSKDVLEKKFYSSSGFALIYNQNLYEEGVVNKKLVDEKILTIHDKLKRNTAITIVNPINLKEITTKISKKGFYPKIFNIVITQEITNILELDLNNPYVEITQVKVNKKFVAKEGTMFNEEKNVASKAPVEKIVIDNLLNSNDTKKNKKVSKKINNIFFLVISDFYYQNSAISLKNDLAQKTKLSTFLVKKINEKKYRLYAGPFKDFNSLKSTYISLNKLGFTDLNIIKQ